jgi:hypothetical protein
MTPMRSRVANGVLVALLVGGCAKDEPAMPSACTSTDAMGYERALRAAPATVRLPGGVAISECLRRVRSDGELQELGLVVHGVAERLALQARDGQDLVAARALGYLGGAAAVGAERSNGISAELARRIAATGVRLDAPALAAALREGQRAGAQRG